MDDMNAWQYVEILSFAHIAYSLRRDSNKQRDKHYEILDCRSDEEYFQPMNIE